MVFAVESINQSDIEDKELNMIVKKKIYVFLKNKLIGIDSVIPLCLQLNRECNCSFTFVLFHGETFDAIVNDNTVLIDAINSVGTIVNLSSARYKYKFLSKIYAISYLIKTIYGVNYSKNYLMHFGALHEKPLNKIANYYKLKRVILCEPTSYGPWITTGNIFNNRETQDVFNNSELYKSPVLNAGVLIGYDKLWNYFKHTKAIDTHQIIFDNARNGSAWVDFIKKRSSDYIDNELNDNNLPSHNKIIIVFIGRLQLDKTGNFIDSFVKMINEIAKNVGNKIPVFIKPHIFSDLDFLEECILKGIAGYNMTYILTKLHPSVLSSRAVMAFFVGASTVINEIANLKVPIVQCLYGFDEAGISFHASKKAYYIATKKTGNLNTVINELLYVDSNPVVYKKRRGTIDCSFMK